VEIERKFVVERVPDDLGGAARRIDQGYVALDQGAEVRVRRIGDELWLTVKGTGGLARVEEELRLSREQFESLWPLTEGRRIEKTRRRMRIAGAEAEVDEYGGDLAGLVVVEVEFGDADGARAFQPPPWFGRELTGEPAYANRSLACDGLPPA
jgi:adenylate cyclase